METEERKEMGVTFAPCLSIKKKKKNQMSWLWLRSYYRIRSFGLALNLGLCKLFLASHKDMLIKIMLRNLYCSSRGFRVSINRVAGWMLFTPLSKDFLSLISVIWFFFYLGHRNTVCSHTSCFISGRSCKSNMLIKETSRV